MTSRSPNPCVAMLALSVAFAGCAGDLEQTQGSSDSASSQVETAEAPLVSDNGSNLNGSNLNGSNLNGSNLNGSNLNGQTPASILASVSLSGIQIGPVTLKEAVLNGTMFEATHGSARWSGMAFAGAELTGFAGDGSTVALRIQEVLPGSGRDADLWTYRVEHRDTNGTWWPLCGGANTPGTAVPLSGRWDLREGVPGGGDKIPDTNAFTFACMGTSAIAKCVSAGYKPWKSVNGISLERLHQACVRLLRADFCGDGLSHTRDGRKVNLYDGHGIQSDTRDWVVEAEWDENGARCYSLLNRSSSLLPVCGGISVNLSCGAKSHFSSGTLLINEVPLLGKLLY